MYVDWSERDDYIARRHGIRVEEALEALADRDALWLDPDPKNVSGQSIRVIGFSTDTRRIITVILLRKNTVESYWGVNAWVSNGRDQRAYRETQR